MTRHIDEEIADLRQMTAEQLPRISHHMFESSGFGGNCRDLVEIGDASGEFSGRVVASRRSLEGDRLLRRVDECFWVVCGG